MKTFIRFIQEEVELEEANQVKMSALKLGDTVKLNKRFGGKQGTVKEVHPNGATVHVSGTETPVFAHHSNFTKINVQKEEVELEESPNRDYIKTVLSRHLNSNRVPHKVSSTVGYDRFNIGPKTHISHDGQGLSVHHDGKEVQYFSSPKLDYKKAAAAAQKLTEANLEEESNLRITKIYNKFPKKATYAVHSLDRKYFKEFDNEVDAKKHLESKKS